MAPDSGGPTSPAVRLAEEFWARMGTNFFASVTDLLADDFRLHYPQSGESFDATGMVALNAEYPAAGVWHFAVDRVVGDDATAVTEVAVTDGDVHARVITFFTVVDERIDAMVEYWPEAFDPPAWRAHLARIPDPGAAALATANGA